MFARRGICLVALVFLGSMLCVAQGPANPNGKTVAEKLGYPANSRLLVIHADDFGMMHTVNHAIEDAFQNHWITSASIMVPCPWFPEVAQWAKSHPDADLGIHLTMNADWTSYRWGPVSGQPKDSSLRDADGYLPLLTEDVDQHAKIPDVETELRAQVDKAQAAGIKLSHLDSHMGTLFSTQPLFDAYLRLGKQYHIPLLLTRQPSIAMNPKLPADFDMNAVPVDKVLQMTPGTPKEMWLDAYKKMLAPLPPGTYELIVHLAYDNDEIRAATFDHPDWGAQWRQNDLNLVSNPEFQKFLKDQNFILVTWGELGKTIPPSAK
ncbi:MAG TPA: polysaccharide deacetylase family protein [Silvibacterium sp.]|nr:polysaccharide deacetylase family protein [Silvibacterium sp.]